MKRPITFILISLIFTSSSSLFLLINGYPSAYARGVPSVRGGEKERESSSSSDSISRFILKIDGIDYSTLKAKVWVTTSDITVSKIINPVSLLDPTDDNKGLIEVPLVFKEGLIKTGERFTACIKVLSDADNIGDNSVCQSGVIGTTKSTQPSQRELADTAHDGNDNDNKHIVVRMSL